MTITLDLDTRRALARIADINTTLDVLNESMNPWQSRTLTPVTRCALCGLHADDSDIPVTTAIVGWRTDLICDNCVAVADLSDFRFDSLTNTYTRRPLS